MDKEMTEDELVAALFAAQATMELEGALTTRVLVEKVGRGKEWVRARLRDLIASGDVELVMAQIVDLAGRTTTVPAYRLRAKDGKRSGTTV